MMNKAINTLVLATVDSLTKFKNKLAYYFAIFAMVFGSTFGTMNAAMAIQGGTVTITGAATEATLDGDGEAFAQSDVVVSGPSGVLTLGADLEIDAITGINDADDNDDTLTIAGGNTLLVGEAVAPVDADNALEFILTGTGTTMNLAATSEATFTLGAGTVLGLVTDGDIDFDGLVDGAADGAGTLLVSGNTQDIDKDIGQTKHLALINITGDTAQFAEEVNATAITMTGTASEFTKVVGADTITVGNAALLNTFTLGITAENGTDKASVIIDDADGADNVVVLAGATTYKADFTAGATGEGEVNVTGAATITGSVGTSTVLLQNLDIDENSTINGNINAALTHIAAGKTLTVKGSNASTSIQLDDATAGITFAGTVAQTSSGILDGDSGTATIGVITAKNAAGVTFTSEIGVTNGVDKLIIDGVANPLVTVSLDGNKIGEIDMDTDATLRLAKTITNAQTVFTTTTGMEDTDIATGSKIYMPVNLSDGQTLKLFATVSQDADFTTALNLALQDNALIDFTAAITDTDDYTVTATAKSEATTASSLGVTTNTARSLKSAYASAINDTVADDDVEDAFKNALNLDGGFGTDEAKKLADQVAPQLDTIGGSSVATRAMTGTVQGIVSNRMASLRSGDAYVTGMSAGNGMSANSGFIQAFGSEAEQKNTGPTTAKVYGYDSSTSGLAIGFDGMTDDGSTIGLSASYSSTDVDGKGTGKSKNAIDSYTVSVYADKATDNGYIEGSLTYGINDNTSSRLVNTAGLSRTYAGNYDSEQISLKVGGGAPQEVKDGTFVTPYFSATGTIISTDSYTETSTTASDALRLKIAQDDINSLVGTAGVKAHMVTDKGTPMISFAINNEFGDTTINSTNTYTGGGTAFKTSTNVEELSATLGLGYSFGNDVSSININYEANANEDDYLSHYGTVKIISKF